MKTQKPNWTSLQIIQNLDRIDELTNQINSHTDCICNLCLEFYSLDKLMEQFSEDDIAGAVIEYNKTWRTANL